MNGTEDIFFSLLRSGLWGSGPADLAGEEPDWEGIFTLARRQAVFGLVFRGASMLPENQMPPMPERMKLMVEAGKVEKQAGKVKGTAREVVATLTEAGFSPLVFKGPAVGKYYREPELRTSGDVDVWVPQRLEAAADLFRDKGLAVMKEADGAFRFAMDGVTVELHRRYYDLHVSPGKLPVVPSACAELLMLSSHILKHAIGVGIGLKQFCDMAMAFSALDGKYDQEELGTCIRKCGLRRWNDLLCSFLAEFLGSPAETLPAYRTVSASPLLRIVMEGGNFGQHADGFRLSKSYTVRRFLGRLPFSLRISPRETFGTLLDLTKGNL